LLNAHRGETPLIEAEYRLEAIAAETAIAKELELERGRRSS
jgi:hypothetical protein